MWHDRVQMAEPYLHTCIQMCQYFIGITSLISKTRSIALQRPICITSWEHVQSFLKVKPDVWRTTTTAWCLYLQNVKIWNMLNVAAPSMWYGSEYSASLVWFLAFSDSLPWGFSAHHKGLQLELEERRKEQRQRVSYTSTPYMWISLFFAHFIWNFIVCFHILHLVYWTCTRSLSQKLEIL